MEVDVKTLKEIDDIFMQINVIGCYNLNTDIRKLCRNIWAEHFPCCFYTSTYQARPAYHTVQITTIFKKL